MLNEDAQHFHCFQMLGQLLGRVTPGGLYNGLRVRVCAAHMGGYFS